MRSSGIFYRKLGTFEDLRIEVYSDASWANLPDGVSSARGSIIMLTSCDDRDYKCVPLDWSSNKIKRIVHSTIAAEALAILDSTDNAIYLGSLLTEIYKESYKQNEIPITVYTDNKSVWENVYSSKQVNEKRLRVTMAELQQLVKRKELDSIKWIPSRHLLADILTKNGVSGDVVLECFSRGCRL